MKKIIIATICACVLLAATIAGVVIAVNHQQQTKKVYTISFQVNQEIIHEIKTSGNETLTLPQPEEKDGFVFMGWFFDENSWQQQLTENFYANQALTQNITVYAYYKEIIVEPTEFFVTFETNGGSEVAGMTTSYIETAPTTTRDNYMFLGWYFDEACTNPVIFPLQVTQDLTLYALWEEESKELTFTFENGTLTGIQDAPDSPFVLNIPTHIQGQPVEKIASSAFSNNSNITEVFIPEGITEIGGSAFRGCENLTTVHLPSSLKTIGEYCFAENSSLSTVHFEEGLEKIESSAFQFCNIQHLELPNSLTVIGTSAFYYNDKLQTASLGNVEIIEAHAFKSCNKLQSIIIPASVQKIGDGAFYSCTSLQDITMLPTTADVHYYAFQETGYYKNDANWDNGVLYIGSYLYGVKTNQTFTHYEVKNGTTIIVQNAFKGTSTTLQSVTLPDSLFYIGIGAFENLTNLSNINLPNSVTTIKTNAFNNTALVNNKSNPYWHENGLYINHYLLAVNNVAMETFTIKEGTTHIIDGSLFGDKAQNVTSIILPESLVYIGEQNFSYTKITTITLNKNLETISQKAFSNCTNLTQIDTTQCKNLTFIATGAFSYCNLESVFIPDTVIFIEDHAFNWNENVNLVIYCQANVKPNGWHEDWNKRGVNRYEVVWGASRP